MVRPPESLCSMHGPWLQGLKPPRSTLLVDGTEVPPFRPLFADCEILSSHAVIAFPPPDEWNAPNRPISYRRKTAGSPCLTVGKIRRSYPKLERKIRALNDPERRHFSAIIKSTKHLGLQPL